MATNNVTAVLTAKDKMSSVFDKAAGSADGLGGRLKSALGSGVAMGAGMKVFDTIVQGVTSHMDSAISRFDTLNNYPKVMSNLGISSAAAEKSITTLSDGITGLPTTLDAAAAGVQRLTSKNNNVGKSTKYFLAMNDAIVAGGASADIQQSAIEQLSQSYSKGKMDMMEWRTLQMAMPAQLNQVAKAMGMTADELGEGLRGGSVSMDSFMQTMQQLDKEGVAGFQSFADQAKNATGGIGTALTNLHTAITRGITASMQEVDKALQANNLPTIGEAINMAGTKISEFGGKVAGVIPKLVQVGVFVKEHATAFKVLAGTVMGVAVGFKAMQVAAAVSGSIKSLTGTLAALTGRAAASVPALGAEAAAETAAGNAARVSASGFMKAGAGLLMMGAGILLAAGGFALLTQSAIALAGAGAPALAIMGGMIAVMAGVAVAAAVFAPALAAGGVALIAFGAGLAACGVAATAFAAALAIGQGAIVNITGALGSLVSTVAAGLTSVLTAVANIFTSIGTAALSAGVGLNLAATAIARLTGLKLGDMSATLMATATGMAAIALSGAGLIRAGNGASILAASLGKIKGSAATAASGINAFAEGVGSGMSKATVKAAAGAKQVHAKLKTASSGAYSSGRAVSQGFAKGMESCLARIQKAASKMVAAAEKATRAKAKIHSPSKVWAKLGGYIGEGFATGMNRTQGIVSEAAAGLANIPHVQASQLAYAGETGVNDGVDYGGVYYFNITTEIDGKAASKQLSGYMAADLATRENRANRKAGRV